MNKSFQDKHQHFLEEILAVMIPCFIFFERHNMNPILYTLIFLIIFSVNLYILYISLHNSLASYKPLRLKYCKGVPYTSIFLLLASLDDYAYANYMGYGKLIIFLYSLIISTIITKWLKFKLLKYSQFPQIFIVMILCILFTPMISQINIGFSFLNIKTVEAKVDYLETLELGTVCEIPLEIHFVYIEKDDAPDIKNRLLCKNEYYKTKAKLNYKRGLLGVRFVEVVEN